MRILWVGVLLCELVALVSGIEALSAAPLASIKKPEFCGSRFIKHIEVCGPSRNIDSQRGTGYRFALIQGNGFCLYKHRLPAGAYRRARSVFVGAWDTDDVPPVRKLENVYGYLHSYANEMAWREDYRREPNGTQYLMVAAAALGHPVSRQWKGYWQRAVQ